MCYDVDTGRELASKQVQFDPDSPETSKVLPPPWSDLLHRVIIPDVTGYLPRFFFARFLLSTLTLALQAGTMHGTPREGTV